MDMCMLENDLAEAKQEFEQFCTAYESMIGKCKSEMDFAGMRMGLGILREDIARWRKACSP